MAQVHPNYIKSSNLVLISGIFSLIGILFESISLSEKIVAAVLILLFVRLISYFIRKGNKTVKYVLLVLLVLGVLSNILAMPAIFLTAPISETLNIIQNALQIWSLILLFKVPKNIREFGEHDYSSPETDFFEN